MHELEACLTQTRITSKVSLDAVSSQLSDKSHELNSTRVELERLKANIASLEANQRSTEAGNLNRVSANWLIS